MKKLLMSILALLIITGCSSSTDIKKEDKDKEVTETEKSNQGDAEKKEEDNGEQKDEDTKDEINNDTDDVETTPESKKKDTGGSSSNNSSASNSSGSNSGTGSTNKQPETTPPQEPAKPTPPPTPQPDPIPESPTNQKAKADQVFAQINAYRQANGKAPFAYSAQLYASSESHALAMAKREALWHSGTAVENITNYDDPFTAWKNSPGHNKILLCNNTEGAVAIYYYNGYYYSVFQCQW